MAPRTVRTAAGAAVTGVCTIVLVTGCGLGDGNGLFPVPGAPSKAKEPASWSTPAPASQTGGGPAPSPALTEVDPSALAYTQGSDTYTWNFSTGGSAVGLCVSDGDGVTCTGTADSSVPDLNRHFPARPGAIELGAAGLRYTFVEDVPLEWRSPRGR
ncbi:hypothetical protein [Dietzia aurantiaca]|uniref:Lipoprotein n=1 Tax=Dietzia aurantiaca TaxID=983873 RepID=A0ABV9PTP4_9ACTN